MINQTRLSSIESQKSFCCFCSFIVDVVVVVDDGVVFFVVVFSKTPSIKVWSKLGQ